MHRSQGSVHIGERRSRGSISRFPLVLVVCVATLAGCGGDDPGRPTQETRRTEVRITLDRDGNGGEEARSKLLTCPSADHMSACRRLAALPAAAFAPVSPDAVCTLVYGGPEVGRIRGRIEGRRVDATFTREDGCEIARYERVESLLRLAGRAPGG